MGKKDKNNDPDNEKKGIKEKVVSAIDQDGNGQIDSTDIILLSMKLPGIRVDRNALLRKELSRQYPEEVVQKAIDTSPAKAGIPTEVVDNIVDEIIKFERNAVSGISTVLGMPGGVAMVATIPADIAQYYGYMLRAAQKMLYLYGFPELGINEKKGVSLDTGTINQLTICLGVMYGVANANKAILAISQALARGVEKKLLQKALTKGTIYPIVKKVAQWFGVRMTKAVFAGFFKKAIPVVGGVIGGGITFATFKPCCIRLKNSLKDTQLSNINHVSTEEENDLYNSIIDGEIIENSSDDDADTNDDSNDDGEDPEDGNEEPKK